MHRRLKKQLLELQHIEALELKHVEKEQRKKIDAALIDVFSRSQNDCGAATAALGVRERSLKMLMRSTSKAQKNAT